MSKSIILSKRRFFNWKFLTPFFIIVVVISWGTDYLYKKCVIIPKGYRLEIIGYQENENIYRGYIADLDSAIILLAEASKKGKNYEQLLIQAYKKCHGSEEYTYDPLQFNYDFIKIGKKLSESNDTLYPCKGVVLYSASCIRERIQEAYEDFMFEAERYAQNPASAKEYM